MTLAGSRVLQIIFIAVVCAIGLGKEPGSTPLPMPGIRTAIMLGTLVVSCLGARLIVLACSAGQPHLRDAILERRLKGFHLVLWALAAAFLIFVVDWTTVVRTNWGWNQSILIDDFLILIPLVAPWLISWALYYELDCDSGETRTQTGRWQFVMLQVRLVLGIGVLPVLSVCLVSDLCRCLAPGLLESPAAALIYMAPLAVLVLTYPWILRLIWNTQIMPPSPRHERLRSLTHQCQVEVGQFIVWNTDGRVANAVATGLIKPLRYVFFTDRLLQILKDEEVESALAHELAHVQHRHVLKRLAALLFPLSVCLLIAAVGRNTDTAALPSSQLEAAPGGWAYLTVIFSLFYMWSVLGWYARQLELQADLTACRWLQPLHQSTDDQGDHGDHGDHSPGVPSSYLSLLAKLTRGCSRDGRGWLHPGAGERRDFLIRSLSRPSVGRRFTQRVNLLGNLFLATAIASVIATIFV